MLSIQTKKSLLYGHESLCSDRPPATCQFNYNWQVAATVLIYNTQTARFHKLTDGHFEFLITILFILSVNMKCSLLWKACSWFVYFDVVQIIFKMFEIAQNITKLRVVANSIIFTTNPILSVKLCFTKTNVFVMRFIYAFELIIRNNTTCNNYIKFIFRISNIDYNL